MSARDRYGPYPPVMIQENDGPWEEWRPDPEPEPQLPPPLGSRDLQIEVSIRFSTGDGLLDEIVKTLDLRGLFAEERLRSSEAEVADLTGREIIEPIRALVRAELFARFQTLPCAWVERDLELVDWYERCTRSYPGKHRLDDKQQWSRIGLQGKTIEEALAKVMEKFERDPGCLPI